MKNPVSVFIPKPDLARWGNFNHTTLVRAELFRAKTNDKTVGKTIEGIVRCSHDLETLAGISVRLKGTNNQTQTDSNGWFSMIIEKPVSNDVLIFTSAGFDTLLVPIHEDFMHVNLKLAEPKPVPQKKRWTIHNFFSF